MKKLKLNDWGTRRVLAEKGLTADRRIGRGAFCAVYEAGPDAVLKLTADSIQYESVRDYLWGDHYPALLGDDHGYAGEQSNEQSLYLFRAERLQPLRFADVATKKLATLFLRRADLAWASPQTQREASRSPRQERRTVRTRESLKQLVDDGVLPASLRQALADLLRMINDYDGLQFDLHRGNLMVRGTDELVLNDVVVSGSLMEADKPLFAI